MFLHSRNGTTFVGLRSRIGGRKQVVYDAASGERVVLDIEGRVANDDIIEAALRQGLETRNVLGGIIAALQERKIWVDIAGAEKPKGL